MKKLIRDAIPALIIGDRLKGSPALDDNENGIRRLTRGEYTYALKLKLYEEWEEAWESPSAEELADCLEVLMATAKLWNIKWENVESERSLKKEVRGGFEGGWELSKP
tara:strand:+ start:281 stop:604 length:324 start_codon:yes stop_codon:yes gene_type:complete